MSDNNDPPPTEESKIRSLHEKRKQKQDQARKGYLTTEQRFLEIETDMVRLIDSLADHDTLIDTNARVNRLLVKAIQHLASKIESLEARINSRNPAP